ncbi:MAG: peptidylprolyl isomerase [Thermoplasmata archaeon]
MNYSFTDLPDSGKNPVVFMNISLKGKLIGKIYIRLFRDVFPAGVENFIQIAEGRTYRVVKRGFGRYVYYKEIRRTYDGCKFYRFLHNNYIVSGDIYNNDGTNAGTIFEDKPIPAYFGEYYYPHETKGVVSLVPFKDESNGQLFFDSTFMITLDDAKPTNILEELNDNQIVIGYIFQGLEVIDKMNELIRPYAGRKYPEFTISKSGLYRGMNSRWYPKPKFLTEKRKFLIPPKQVIDDEVSRKIQ